MVLLHCGNQEDPLGRHNVFSTYSEHSLEQIFSFMAVNVFTERKNDRKRQKDNAVKTKKERNKLAQKRRKI
jgi:hypothetical protein